MQPYFFRLFGTKRDLFLAAVHRGFDQVEEVFGQAADEAEGNLLDAMGAAYAQMLGRRDELLLQLLAYAAAADPDVQVQGILALGAGLRTLPWTGTIMIVAPFAGILAGRIGGRPVVVTGMVLQAAALAWFGMVAEVATPYTILLPGFLLGAIFQHVATLPTAASFLSGFHLAVFAGAGLVMLGAAVAVLLPAIANGRAEALSAPALTAEVA